MPCVIGCLALFVPRLVLILVAIFSDYLSTAYPNHNQCTGARNRPTEHLARAAGATLPLGGTDQLLPLRTRVPAQQDGGLLH